MMYQDEKLKVYQEIIGNASIKRYQNPAKGVSPLVWTEVFLREVSRRPEQAILHFWPMEQTVILGQMDAQVPHFLKGLAYLKSQGYTPLVRSLGGLGVVVDEGVLNVSLILPNPKGHKFDFHQSYELMVSLIGDAVADFTNQIEVYEIEDSYCPGTYDLSIGGKKFAGLAQRMYQKAIVVSAYISLTGDQAKRGQLIADFYRAGFDDGEISSRYPQVNPSSMANLSDLLGKRLSIEQMKERIEKVLQDQGYTISDIRNTEEGIADFVKISQEMTRKLKQYGL